MERPSRLGHRLTSPRGPRATSPFSFGSEKLASGRVSGFFISFLSRFQTQGEERAELPSACGARLNLFVYPVYRVDLRVGSEVSARSHRPSRPASSHRGRAGPPGRVSGLPLGTFHPECTGPLLCPCPTGNAQAGCVQFWRERLFYQGAHGSVWGWLWSRQGLQMLLSVTGLSSGSVSPRTAACCYFVNFSVLVTLSPSAETQVPQPITSRWGPMRPKKSHFPFGLRSVPHAQLSQGNPRTRPRAPARSLVQGRGGTHREDLIHTASSEYPPPHSIPARKGVVITHTWSMEEQGLHLGP